MEKAILLAVTASLGASLSSAASEWQSTPVTVTGYYAYSPGSTFLTTSNNQDLGGCTGGNTPRYLILDPSQSNFTQLLTMLMTAQATGQTVSLYYNGCLGGYNLISGVAVPNSW